MLRNYYQENLTVAADGKGNVVFDKEELVGLSEDDMADILQRFPKKCQRLVDAALAERCHIVTKRAINALHTLVNNSVYSSHPGENHSDMPKVDMAYAKFYETMASLPPAEKKALYAVEIPYPNGDHVRLNREATTVGFLLEGARNNCANFAGRNLARVVYIYKPNAKFKSDVKADQFIGQLRDQIVKPDAEKLEEPTPAERALFRFAHSNRSNVRAAVAVANR